MVTQKRKMIFREGVDPEVGWVKGCCEVSGIKAQRVSDGFGNVEVTGDLCEGCFSGVGGTESLLEQAGKKKGDE